MIKIGIYGASCWMKYAGRITLAFIRTNTVLQLS
jgi:hypothetical protein